MAILLCRFFLTHMSMCTFLPDITDGKDGRCFNTRTDMEIARDKNKFTLLAVMLLCLIAFFFNNEALTPDVMEARNIVTAREMVSDGNWLVPTMNGDLSLDKPPLPIWIAAVIETACPGSLSAQRCASAVMATLWVLVMYLFAYELSRRKDYALLVVSVFVTVYQVVYMGRTATWDIYCHSFMMWAIYFLWRGFYDECYYSTSHSARWFTLAGIMMGLSFMSKGPVSFYALLLPFLVMALWHRLPDMSGKWKHFAIMIALCVAISSWWYVYLYLSHPAETACVLQREITAWGSHNVRPWYYYWRFFSETGVWALFLLAAFAVPFWIRKVPQRHVYVISLAWTIASLLLLSLVPEKKMRYLLPMMAPCSMTIACLLLSYFYDNRSRAKKMLFRLNGGIVSLVAIGIPLAVLFTSLRDVVSAWHLVVACTVLPVLGILTAVATWRIDMKNFVYAALLIFAVAETVLLANIGRALGNPQMHSLNVLAADPKLKTMEAYHVEGSEPRIELVYAMGKKILPIDLADSTDVVRRLPFIVVCKENECDELTASLPKYLETRDLGLFDENRQKKGTKHYRQSLVCRVFVVSGK